MGAGVAWSPECCFEQEDHALILPSAAVQGLIREWDEGTVRLAARLVAQLDVGGGTDGGMVTGIVRTSVGGHALRFVGDVSLASLLDDASAGVVPGAALGIETVSEHIGFYLLGGALLWIEQPALSSNTAVTPLLSPGLLLQ